MQFLLSLVLKCLPKALWYSSKSLLNKLGVFVGTDMVDWDVVAVFVVGHEESFSVTVHNYVANHVEEISKKKVRGY